MVESMCSCSVIHMASWKGLVCQHRRQCTQYAHTSAAALCAAVVSRQVSNCALPERYLPKKPASEDVAGRGAGGRFRERKRSPPYDSESGPSRADRSFRNTGRKEGEDATEMKSLPPTSFREKLGNKFVAGGENAPVKVSEPYEERRKRSQQLPADEEYPASDASVFPPSNDKQRKGGMESHDPEVLAKDYCISLLALAPQPEVKLRMKMSRKNFTSEVMDAVIADLQRCGLQSDQEYAELFARSRWNGNAWGPMRIKFELLRRGLSQENVEAGLSHVFRGNDDADQVDDEEEGAAGRWGMNQKAAEQLISQARQRWSQGSGLETNTRKRRMAGWLQRRGFSWDITKDLLRVLEHEGREELY